MAIFHFSASIVQRSKGQSSVAKAAYNAREHLTNELTGEDHDYTKAGGLVFSGIFAPKSAPEWVQNREKLWSEVEKAETRKNSQLARSLEISLPHELTDEQRKQLLTDFVRESFIRRGMVADVAIHRPDRDGDERNHHAHILLTMREIGPDGFVDKMRDLNGKAQLKEWREQWEKKANRYLERHGHEARIDHRSLEAQGIDREATKHLGATASQFEREGIPSEMGGLNRDIDARNQERDRIKAEKDATEKEIKTAERVKQIAEDQKKIRQTMRAGHTAATLYDRAGMESQQLDALRHNDERNEKKAQAREQDDTAAKKRRDEEAKEQKRSEAPRQKTQGQKAAAHKRATTEQTDSKQKQWKSLADELAGTRFTSSRSGREEDYERER